MATAAPQHAPPQQQMNAMMEKEEEERQEEEREKELQQREAELQRRTQQLQRRTRRWQARARAALTTRPMCAAHLTSASTGTQFTSFTGTNVQILTQKRYAAGCTGLL